MGTRYRIGHVVGPGLPSGGSPGQVVTKISDTNYDTQWQYPAALANNRNLLDNWDFRNPVNQRGETTYSGSGYTIDRWRINNSRGTAEVTENGLVLSATGGASYYEQRLDIDLTGKAVTLSFMAGGNVYSVSGTLAKDGIRILTSATPVGIRFAAVWDTTVSKYCVYFMVFDGNVETITSAKLEVGLISTLANDPPMDYGMELLKCQRHLFATNGRYRAAAVSANDIDFYIPAQLRDVSAFDGRTPFVASIDNMDTALEGFAFSILGANMGVIGVRASKASHGLTDALLNCYGTDGAPVLFSAEL